MATSLLGVIDHVVYSDLSEANYLVLTGLWDVRLADGDCIAVLTLFSVVAKSLESFFAFAVVTSSSDGPMALFRSEQLSKGLGFVIAGCFSCRVVLMKSTTCLVSVYAASQNALPGQIAISRIRWPSMRASIPRSVITALKVASDSLLVKSSVVILCSWVEICFGLICKFAARLMRTLSSFSVYVIQISCRSHAYFGSANSWTLLQ